MSGSKLSVLLIEDNPGDAHLVRVYLNCDDDISLHWESSLGQALGFLAADSADVILADLHLPDCYGLKIVETLILNHPEIPVIVLTGQKADELANKAIEMGAEDYQVKDELDERYLRKALRYAVQRHHLSHCVRQTCATLEERNQQLKEAQMKLVQHEKLATIGQLSAGIAHEINNPLGYLKSNIGTMRMYTRHLIEYVSILLDHNDCRIAGAEYKRLRIGTILDDYADVLDEAEDGVERIEDICRNLKIFTHRGVSNVSEADLNACLKSTVRVAWNALKYHAEVKYDLDDDLPLVTCMPQELNQVFMNLLLNAAHAIEEKVGFAQDKQQRGTITITTCCNGDWVKVGVTDTGCGIPEHVLPHIFDPFYTTKAAGVGSGLGLSLSSDVISRHCGSIDVDTSPHGTTFTLVLPVKLEMQVQDQYLN